MKNRKLLFMIYTLACFVAVGTCLIVDIAINRQVTWGAYPLLSVSFVWMAASPVFVKKHGVILSLCTFTLLVAPYLYLLSRITPVTDWFMPIGLPSFVCGIIALWILYPLFRYAKITIWYKTAITVILLGVVISPVINYFADIYTGEEPFALNRIISLFSCIVAAAVISILAYVKSQNAVKNKS